MTTPDKPALRRRPSFTTIGNLFRKSEEKPQTEANSRKTQHMSLRLDGGLKNLIFGGKDSPSTKENQVENTPNASKSPSATDPLKRKVKRRPSLKDLKSKFLEKAGKLRSPKKSKSSPKSVDTTFQKNRKLTLRIDAAIKEFAPMSGDDVFKAEINALSPMISPNGKQESQPISKASSEESVGDSMDVSDSEEIFSDCDIENYEEEERLRLALAALDSDSEVPSAIKVVKAFDIICESPMKKSPRMPRRF